MKGIFNLLRGLVLLGWACGIADVLAADAVDVRVEFERQPGLVVAALREIHPELAEEDTLPLVRVYGDGRVLLHRPVYMKRAGQYELHLGEYELEALMSGLAVALQGFEHEKARDAVREAEQRRWSNAQDWRDFRVYHAADASISEIYLKVVSVQPPQSHGQPVTLQPRLESWRGLSIDAALYPEVLAVQDLLHAEGLLRGLAQRPDAARIGGGQP